jgi:hypothetical protein
VPRTINENLVDACQEQLGCYRDGGGVSEGMDYRHRLNACETKESRMRRGSYVHASHVVTPLARCVRDNAFMAVRGIVQCSAVLYPWSTLVHCSGVV